MSENIDIRGGLGRGGFCPTHFFPWLWFSCCSHFFQRNSVRATQLSQLTRAAGHIGFICEVSLRNLGRGRQLPHHTELWETSHPHLCPSMTQLAPYSSQRHVYKHYLVSSAKMKMWRVQGNHYYFPFYKQEKTKLRKSSWLLPGLRNSQSWKEGYTWIFRHLVLKSSHRTGSI